MSNYLYIAQLAIPVDLVDDFTRLYDEGYLPSLLKINGVTSAKRYKLQWSDTSDMPEYLAVYELDSPYIPKSSAWKQASIDCGWAKIIRPHLKTRKHGMFRKLDPVKY